MAGSSERIFLIVYAPNGDVREIPIGDIPVVIGRDESADIRVDDKKVSRRHAAFKVINDEPWVEDLGSVNGVKVNGKRIDRRAMLCDGDVVRVGGYEVRVRPREAGGAPERAVSSLPGVDQETPPSGVRLSSSAVQRETGAVRAGAAEDDAPVLHGIDDPVAGEAFVLRRGENIIGRLEDCDVPVLDGSVSRQHARVLYSRERVSVTDLNSSNGCFVNDVRVDALELSDGDALRIGSVNFRVSIPSTIPGRSGEPLELSAQRRVGSTARGGSRYLIAGIAVLVLAVAVVAVAVRQASKIVLTEDDDPLPPLVATTSPDGGEATEPVPLDAGATAVAVAVDPSVEDPPPAEDPPLVEPALPPPAPPDAGVAAVAVIEPPADGAGTAIVMAPRPVTTATSPHGRTDEAGLPLGLPEVDEAFDFDGFVASKLEAATVANTAGQFGEVRAVLASLLVRDPINRDAHAMLAVVDRNESAKAKLDSADLLRSKGKLLEAFKIYSEIPVEAVSGAEAGKQVIELKPQVIEKELARAKREAKRRKSWAKAHDRLMEVLAIEPGSEEARQAIWDLERSMRRRRMRFVPWIPPEGEGLVKVASDDEQNEALERYLKDPALVRIAKLYADGALKKAKSKASRLARSASGKKRKKAKRLSKQLAALGTKYERVRTALGNDPAEAWAHLIELEQMERDILPENVTSYFRTELAHSIADAFAERGEAFFQQKRYEEAFQKWDAGQKLNRLNPKILAGLKKLEKTAEDFAKEAELAAQRGEQGICARWRQITRMTTGTAEVHRRARDRVKQACGSG